MNTSKLECICENHSVAPHWGCPIKSSAVCPSCRAGLSAVGAPCIWKDCASNALPITSGTPKTLTAAISNGVYAPIDTQEEVIDATYATVRDFLAQRFTLAYAKATSPGEIARLETLFAEIVRRSVK